MKPITKLGLTFDDVLLIPKKSTILSRKEVDLSSYFTKNILLSSPLVSTNMDTVTEAPMAIALAEHGGIGIIHRFLSIEQQVAEVKKVKKKDLLVAGAIGVYGDYFDRATALIKAGVDVINIDIAHGHSELLLTVLRHLKKKYKKTDIIAGTVATAEGTKELIEAGADGIKVGVGAGSICITRLVAGSGVPQITAVLDCAKVGKKYGIPISSDAGVRRSGDAVKALAAGASTIMSGSLYAGFAESPGKEITKENKKYKIIRGMASSEANAIRIKKDPHLKRDLKEYAAEGVEGLVPFKGSVYDFLPSFLMGIKSGFTYSGAKNIQELWKNAEFIQISPSSLIESRPHDIIL
jgi:IMP dehydrogenase